MKRDAAPASLLDLLAARVTNDATAPAIVVPAASRLVPDRGEDLYSWGDVAASAVRLARRFEQEGLGRGDRIVHVGPHSADAVVVDLACLLSGTVHVFLHHDDGRAAHARQAEWLAPRGIVLTGPTHLTAMPAGVGETVARFDARYDVGGRPLVSREGLEGLGDEVAERCERCDPDACSTIILSSGTTGHPHGVMHSQRSLLANAVASAAVFLDDPRDVRLSWLPLSHALPRTGDLSTALVRGACLAIVEDRRRLLDACREVSPTAILGVPAMFERIERAVAAGTIRDLREALGGRVRVCVSGGAALKRRTIRGFAAAGVPLVEGYGLAEAGPVVTLASPRTAREGTVGPPLQGVEVKLDPDSQLLVRTPGRCLGVIEPSGCVITHQRHDPHDWLATGDLAAIDPDGHVRITGRAGDAVVLAGGEKIPPAELERAIGEDEAVAQVCVVGHGLRRPLALVVPEPAVLRAAVRRMRLTVVSRRAALAHPKVLAWLARRIEHRQRPLPKAWRAGLMLVVGRPFDAAHGEATVSLKLKRPAIADHFRFAIAAAADGRMLPGMSAIPADGRRSGATAMNLSATVWSRGDVTGFAEAAAASAEPLPERVSSIADAAEDVIGAMKADGTIFEKDGRSRGKFSRAAEARLGETGLWGLTVPSDRGGAGAGIAELARVVARLAAHSPTAAGMLSVHASIGAVSAVDAFGSPSQRARWLQPLARGEPLSVFGGTEPDAGCDLSRVATTLERRDEKLLVTGTKMFITGAAHGRLVKLLAKLDGRPAVALVRLPDHDTDTFRLEPSNIHPLRHAHNATLVFDRHEADAADLLEAPKGGDAMAIVWHGLNRGRVTLAAQAAGTQRIMLDHASQHARGRVTWGRPIVSRQLVQGRLATIACGIVVAEAVSAWAAHAVDASGGPEHGGGELEAITAKIIAGECVRDSAIAAVGVHAGRTFLVGHPLGDAIHDHLAVGIYEGESELLGLALFKGLAKRHPLAAVAGAAPLKRATAWLAWRLARMTAAGPRLDGVLDARLRGFAQGARRRLDRLALGIDRAIRSHGRRLAEEQLVVADLSARARDLLAVIAVAHHADRHGDTPDTPWRLAAAEAFCRTALARAAAPATCDAIAPLAARLGG